MCKLTKKSYHLEIRSKEQFIKKIQVDIENDTREIVVNFNRNHDKIILTSTEPNQSSQLTQNETFCLLTIAKTPSPDLLNTIFCNKLDFKKKKLLESYGFKENKKFYNYFSFSFNKKNGLFIERTELSKGLIPISNEEADTVVRFINKTSSDELILDSIFSNKEKRDIGFVLRLEYSESTNNNSNHDDFWYQIIPIIGKTNKELGMIFGGGKGKSLKGKI